MGLQANVIVKGFPVDVDLVEYLNAVDNPGLILNAAYHISVPMDITELSNFGIKFELLMDLFKFDSRLPMLYKHRKPNSASFVEYMNSLSSFGAFFCK